jgi:3-dehydroquinate synthase
MRTLRYLIRPEFRHVVTFTRGALQPGNPVLARAFAPEGGRPARVLVVVETGLERVRPKLAREIESYFAAHGRRAELVGPPLRLSGGEAAKNNWRLVERLWAAIERHGLSRQSYVLAVGGGALLDVVGFAAATAHRGVRLVRMPTTSLSQADGGVGVKNAVNFFGKKNWVGAFAVPAAVVNDLDFLATLPDEAARAGVVEAFKVGLIRDGRLASRIAAQAAQLARRERGVLERVIQESARLHVRHIAQGGDPFEMGAARPLDFGHWAAHKLEQLSGFRLAHGDAVAVGLVIDARYSAACGWVSAAMAERVVEVLGQLGCDTGDGARRPLVRRLLRRRDARGRPAVLAGLEEFRQHLGGALRLTLLRVWGRGEETDTIDLALMRRVIEETAGA